MAPLDLFRLLLHEMIFFLLRISWARVGLRPTEPQETLRTKEAFKNSSRTSWMELVDIAKIFEWFFSGFSPVIKL